MRAPRFVAAFDGERVVVGLGTMWGEQTARKMLGEAGFTSIEAAHLDGDIVNTYIIAGKG